MKRRPSLLSVAHKPPSTTIIHSPYSPGQEYKPLTRHSIIPDVSVSTTHIRRGKRRGGREEKRTREKERETLSSPQCQNDKIGSFAMEAAGSCWILASGGGFLVSAMGFGLESYWRSVITVLGKRDTKNVAVNSDT